MHGGSEPGASASRDSPTGGSRDDGRWLEQSGRDPEAFGRFYDRHAGPMFAFFRRRVGDRQAALDLTAETFAQAFAARRSYRRTQAPAGAWLYAIARRQLARWYERREVDERMRRQLGVERVLVGEREEEQLERVLESDAAHRLLGGELAALPDATQRALELRVVRELSYAEVAAELGCSAGAARVRVARGLRWLAQSLGRNR